ncbi:MAG: non-ribosomal peptide synthetase [Bryobacteraceae bacterium]
MKHQQQYSYAAMVASGSKATSDRFVSTREQIWQHGLERPKAAAIVAGCRLITFGELIDRASTLAARFREQLPSDRKNPIAICSGDSVRMIVAALAAWQVGYPYLPVDPAGPRERLRHMLKECCVALIATESSGLQKLPGGSWRHIPLDECSEAGSGEMDAIKTQATSVEPNDPAYIIYTSGSTGQPKGVAVSHANLAHLVGWYKEAFSVSEEDRGTQLASLTFDAAILETWTLLAAGAAVHIPDSSAKLIPERLRDYLVSEGITHCFAVTAIAERLLAVEWPPSTKLRFLLTGADTLRVFPSKGLPFQVVNNYGPTECTVLATSGVVPSDGDPTTTPTIGRAIPGVQIYLLGSHLEPVSDGEEGEIYIGGAGVSLGYIGHPDLTMERFVTNPFQDGSGLLQDGSGLLQNGSRLYRTGDLARKLPNGEFEFRGRIDQQIKLRGYRIEPGEIVHALRNHPVVASAIVKTIRVPSGEQLAAYLVLRTNTSGADLRAHLATLLPDYMIPDRFVRIADLPLTGNGKVDLAALPLPDSSNTLEEDQEYAAPETEIEQEVTAILSALLGGRRIGLADNFFRLGGHSLLAAQVISRVRQTFGVELPIRTVFETPTVAGLSRAIEQKMVDLLAALPPEDVGESGSLSL